MTLGGRAKIGQLACPQKEKKVGKGGKGKKCFESCKAPCEIVKRRATTRKTSWYHFCKIALTESCKTDSIYPFLSLYCLENKTGSLLSHPSSYCWLKQRSPTPRQRLTNRLWTTWNRAAQVACERAWTAPLM